MKSNTYLYGEGVDVPPIPVDVADERIVLLKVNLEKEVNLNFMDRDNHRVNEIIGAIKYWEKMKTGEGI